MGVSQNENEFISINPKYQHKHSLIHYFLIRYKIFPGNSINGTLLDMIKLDSKRHPYEKDNKSPCDRGQ
jgi:hypothetical protein